MKKDSRKKLVCCFFTALGVITIGLQIAVLVIVARDSTSNSLNSPNIATTVRLNNGIEIPIVGIGSAWHRCVAGNTRLLKVDDEHTHTRILHNKKSVCETTSTQARQSVMAAIDRGYRHVDTAHIYGTEIGVGEAVNAKINEGVVTREEMFVTSKLWKSFANPELVRGAVNDSLTKLNLNYVNLYLIHWPMNSPESFDFELMDTWRALEELVDEGLIKSIGLSNFNITQVDHIFDNARIKPVMNQIESHPHCLNKQLVRHCLSRNVAVTAYSPLGTPGHPQFALDSRRVINEPNIHAVAKRHGKTPAQVLIRYQIQNGVLAIPKSDTHDRVISNFDVFNFNLSEEDIREIESIGYYYRTSNEDDDIGHHQFPFATYECL